MTDHAYALAILAHPDDESFLFAGTTLKLADQGKKVVVVCATKGEKGADRLNRNLTESEMADIRLQELTEACRVLNCDYINFFKYPDGGIDKSDFNRLVFELSGFIDIFQPEIILTFGPEGVSGHMDHITIGQAAIDAAGVADHRTKAIWQASMPASTINAFNEHLNSKKIHHTHYRSRILKGVPDEKLLKIDISKYNNRKLAALQAHQSQFLPHFYIDVFQNYEYFEVIDLMKPNPVLQKKDMRTVPAS